MGTVPDDGALVRAYLGGDAEALGALYDRHAPALFGYLRARVGAHEAEDVLQDTFMQAARDLDRYDHRGKMRQWLFTLARSRALDRIRRRGRRRERALGDSEEERLSHPGRDPLQHQADRELAGRIASAVAVLPDKHREVFLLREEGGLTFREIADTLVIPLNTALSHMHRATLALRANLADLEKELDE